MMDLENAEKAMKHGAVAGFIAGGLAMIIVLLALARNSGGILSEVADPWNLVDAGIVLTCALGTLLRSRTAAVGLVCYYTVTKILMLLEFGRVPALLPLLCFFYFFAKAAVGAFAYHKIRREEEPAYRAAPRWAYFLWIPGGLAVLVLVALFVLSCFIPPIGVVTGQELGAKNLSLLHEKGILESDEQVVLFYTADAWSILEDGNVITNRRVVKYKTADDGLSINSEIFPEIVDFYVSHKGDDLSDTIIAVETYDGLRINLLAYTEDGGDERFLKELGKRAINAER